MNRLPEPGSPAFLAESDQYRAAEYHAARLVDEMAHRDGVTVVAPSGPWASGMLEAASHGPRLFCAHLASEHGPRPRLTLIPATLLCDECLPGALARLHAAALAQCAKCGLVNALRPTAARRAHTVAYGRLCWFCVVLEHPQTRGRR